MVLSNLKNIFFITLLEKNSLWTHHHHHAIAGLYVSGWAGTGPVGVILSTMTVGFDVGRAVLKDLQEGKLTVRAGRDAALETLKHRGEIWFCHLFVLCMRKKLRNHLVLWA